MTISFSGLASGLDTSSWVESLVRLRQAKVTTLEEKKESLQLSQSSLSTIKSIFSSFRASIERVTDSRFGISTMDLFLQNVATSSDTSKLIASAIPEAEAKTYTINVDRLATSTEARSAFYTVETIHSTATQEARLSTLGITEGGITVTKDGVTHGITVRKNDTMSTLINKFKSIGVDASYNEETGTFNVNVSIGDIQDVSGTGIIQALHLTGVNEGYETQKLQYQETQRTVEQAALQTTLRELIDPNAENVDEDIDIRTGSKTVKVQNSSNEIVTFAVNGNTTLGGFIDHLKDAGMFAKLTEEGTLEVTGGQILDTGTFNAVKFFGLTEEPHNAMVTGNELTETILVPEIVSLQTKLVEDLGVTRGFYEVTNPDDDKFYLSIYSGQTMSDLITDLGNIGINARLDGDNGILTLTGGTYKTLADWEVVDLCGNGTIVGVDSDHQKGTNLLSSLGLDIEEHITVSSTRAKSRALTYSQTNLVSENDLIANYVTMPTDKTLVVHEKTGEAIGTVMISDTSTFASLFADLADYDIDGEIHNGEVMFDSNRELYVTGELLDKMGMTTTYETTYVTTTIGTSQSTELKTYDTTQLADIDDVINDYVRITDENNQLIVKDKDGNPLTTIIVTDTMTFGELFNQLAEYGVTGRIIDGKVTFVSDNQGYVDGSFITAAMNCTVSYQTVITTTTVGGTQTTSSKTFSYSDVATEDNKLSDFIEADGKVLNIKDRDGNVIGSFTATNDTTFAELFNSIASWGMDGDINEGRVTFIHDFDGYVDGSLATALGVTTDYNTVTTTRTYGTSTTGELKRYNYTDVASSTSRVGDFINLTNANSILTINNVNVSPDFIMGITEYDTSGVTSLSFISESSTIASAATYKITTTDEMLQLATMVNEGRVASTKAVFILDSDLDMEDVEWTCIGTDTNAFRSKFYGNGHSISNLSITDSSSADGKNYGLFGKTTSASEIKDLKLENEIVYVTTEADETRVGGLAGLSYGKIINCSVSGTMSYEGEITDSKDICLGGLAGRAQGTITGSKTDIVITNGSYYTGGMVGRGALLEITSCIAEGTITATNAPSNGALGTQCGGIIAYTTSRVTIDSCYSSVNIESNFRNIGGIFGLISSSDVSITNCAVNGELNATYHTTSLKQGAIAGSVLYDDIVVTGCIVDSTSYASAGNKYFYNDPNNADVTTGSVSDASIIGLGSSGLGKKEIRITANMTFGQIAAMLANYGIDMDIEDGRATFHGIDGQYVSGSFAQALGVQTHYDTITTTTTYGTSTTGELKRYNYTDVASSTSRVGDFINLTNENSILTLNDVSVSPDFIMGITEYDTSGVTSLSFISASSTISSAATYKISTTDEMLQLATMVNDGRVSKNAVFILDSDLDMDGVSWTCIGTSTNNFKSKFYGNGHKISNLSITDSSSADGQNYGLFGYIANTSEIKDLAVVNESVSVTNGDRIGGLAGISRGKITNCSVSGTMSYEGEITTDTKSLGGIAGYAQSTILGSKTDIIISKAANFTGGIVGSSNSSDAYIVSCIAEGTIYTENCNNDSSYNCYSGGVIGWCSGLTVDSTYASVDICGKGAMLSGIVGYGNPTAITNCAVNGILSGNANNKAAIGRITDSTTVTDCIVDSATYTSAGNTIFRNRTDESGVTIGAVADASIIGLGSSGLGKKEIRITANMTFGQIAANLANYGIDMDIEDGRATFHGIDGQYVSGSFAQALGVQTHYDTITTTTTYGTSTTGELKRYDITDVATNDNKLSDFGLSGTLYVRDYQGNTVYTYTTDGNATFADMFNTLAAYGVDGDLNEGRVTFIHSHGGFVDGSLVDAMGVTTTFITETMTVGTTSTGTLKYYTEKEYATDASVIKTFISDVNGKVLNVKDSDGNVLGTFTATNDSTFADMFNAIAQYGADGDINQGKVTFTHSLGGYVDGSLATALGVSATNVTETVTVGTAVSGTLQTYTQTQYATSASKISDFVSDAAGKTLYVRDASGDNEIYTYTVGENDTFADMFAALAPYGVDGDIENGIVTFTSAYGEFVSGGTLETALGISVSYVYETISVGTSQHTSAFSVTFDAHEGSTFAQIGLNNNTYTFTINRQQTGDGTTALSVNKTDTIGDFFGSLAQYGIDASIHDGRIILQSDKGYYITGALADELGISTSTYTQTVQGSQTQNITLHGSATIDTSDTFTINISTVLSVTTTGEVEVSDTFTLDYERTMDITTTGYVTVTCHDTQSINLTLTVNSTGSTVITVTTNVQQTLNVTTTCITAITSYTTIVVDLNQTVETTNTVRGYVEHVSAAKLYTVTQTATASSVITTTTTYTEPVIDSAYTNDIRYRFNKDGDTYYPSTAQEASQLKLINLALSRTTSGTVTATVTQTYTTTVVASTWVEPDGDYQSYREAYFPDGFDSSTRVYDYIEYTQGNDQARADMGHVAQFYLMHKTSDGATSYTTVKVTLTTSTTYSDIEEAIGDATSTDIYWTYYHHGSGYYSHRIHYGSGWAMYSTNEYATRALLLPNNFYSDNDAAHYEYTTTTVTGTMTTTTTVRANLMYLATADGALWIDLFDGSQIHHVTFSGQSTVGDVYDSIMAFTTDVTFGIITSPSNSSHYCITISDNGTHPSCIAGISSSLSKVLSFASNGPTYQTDTFTVTQTATVTFSQTTSTTLEVAYVDIQDIHGALAGQTASQYLGQLYHEGEIDYSDEDYLAAHAIYYGDLNYYYNAELGDYYSNESGTLVRTYGQGGNGSSKNIVRLAYSTNVVSTTTASAQLTQTIASTTTLTIISTGTTTVNVQTTQKITFTVASTGTVEIHKTLTIDATGTAAVTTTGSVSFTINDEITVSDTVTVTTTGSTTLNISEIRTININQTVGVDVSGDITVSITSTRTVTGNTTSGQNSVTSIMNSNTTFAELGKEGGKINVTYEGNSYTITLNADNTIGDMLTALAGYGISGTVNNGSVFIQGTADGYITGASGGMASIGVSSAWTSNTISHMTNTAGNAQYRTITATMTGTTTLGDLGLGEGSISGYYHGQAFTVTMNANTTLDGLIGALGANGIEAYILDGIMHFDGTVAGYITGATGAGSSLGASSSYTNSTITHNTNSAGSENSHTVTTTMNGTTTLGDLGLGDGSISGYYHGEAFTVTMNANSTIDSIIGALGANGIEAYVLNGVMHFDGTVAGYITGATGSASSLGAASANTTSVLSHYTNSAGAYKARTITATMTGTTTLGQIGLGEGSISGYYHDTAFTVTMNADTTIDGLIGALAANGIEAYVLNGQMHFEGTTAGYITGATGAGTSLGAASAFNTTSTTVVEGTNTAGEYKSRTITATMTGTTTLGQIDLGEGSISGYYHDTAFTVTMNADTTIDGLIGALAANGIEAYVLDGQMHFEGTTAGYITGATGAGTSLGASSAFNTTSTTVVEGTNTAGEYKSRTITATMTGTTTLGDLGLGEGSISGFYHDTAFTVTMNADTTIDGLIGALAANGIEAYVLDGQMHFEGTTAGYITGATGAGTSLGAGSAFDTTSTTVVEGTNTAGDYKERTLTDYMASDTTLAELGWDAGTVDVVYGGQAYTVTMHTDNSIGDLISALAGFGISGTISADGKLTLQGSYDGYITGATGGLANNLGIEQSFVRSTSTVINGATSIGKQHTILVTNTMNLSTTFADLGLDGGSASVEYGGNNYIINMSATSTMDDFLTALAGFGISGSITNGVMTLQGTYDGWILGATGGISDLGITISKTQTVTTTTTGANSTSDQLIATFNPVLNKSVKMTDLQDADGNSLGITTGSYYIYEDGVRTTHEITEDTTVNDFMAEIANYGLIADVAEDGAIAVSGMRKSFMATSALGNTQNSNVVDRLFATWDFNNIYESNNLEKPVTVIDAISRDTKLSNIVQASESAEGQFEEGLITILRNGVQTHMYINADDTVGTFLDELSMFGFDSVINDKGQIIIRNTGDSRLVNYTSPDPNAKSSNILDIIGADSDNWVITKSYESDVQNVVTYEDLFIDATEETKFSDLARTISGFDSDGNALNIQSATENDSELKTALDGFDGKLEVLIDGETNYINVSKDETIGSLLDKFRAMGLEANISAGKITIHSGYKELSINSPTAGGSAILSSGLLDFNEDIGGFTASNEKVISTTTEDRVLSVSDWASGSTKLSALNIKAGTLSVYKDGKRAKVTIDENDTFATLQSKIQQTLSDVVVNFENGYLTMSSETGKVTVGASTDTSNFLSITGLKAKEDGTVLAEKELFRADHGSKITQSGLFRMGDITTGTFTIGTHEITITDDTTIDDIVNEINSHSLATDANPDDYTGAIAHWDSFEGKMVIESRTSGNMFINIEAGTSNFTDIMGYTSSVTRNGDSYSAINTDAQTVGHNAKIRIDGVTYTANSNTMGSDVTRIEGLTLNLKETTDDEAIILKVEKDKETLADAMEDVVTAYNDLMTGVDEAIAAGGELSDQTTLKMLRNQLRSYMTGADIGASIFRNLDSIGISVNKAIGSNISTKTADIVNLTFNRETFYDKFSDNPAAVKSLLVGGTSNKGIFTKIEELIEGALAGVSGYFDTQNAAYSNQISTLNKQITRANQEIARYREQLESRFQSMDMLIAQMQEQYQSFLKS